MNAHDFLDTLHPLLMQNGKPEFIRSENGPEFIAMHLQDRSKRVSVQLMQIYPGSPWAKGYNESFNGTLRKEVLNTDWLHTTNMFTLQSMLGSGSTTRPDLIMHWV